MFVFTTILITKVNKKFFINDRNDQWKTSYITNQDDLQFLSQNYVFFFFNEQHYINPGVLQIFQNKKNNFFFIKDCSSISNSNSSPFSVYRTVNRDNKIFLIFTNHLYNGNSIAKYKTKKSHILICNHINNQCLLVYNYGKKQKEGMFFFVQNNSNIDEIKKKIQEIKQEKFVIFFVIE